MVSGMGTTTFAAHSIAITAEELFYIPGYGLRTATSAMIGHAIGERDPEKLRLTETVSIALTVGAMLMTGTLLFFTAYPLMRIFTSSLPVARLGAEMLRLVAFTEPFFGLMVVLEGIAYGKGRTRGIFVVETISMWGIRILFTWFCTHVWMTDLRAVWYCMIADNIFKALMLLTVYAAEKRKERKRADGFA
jgi:Na+-driven multidrug efflux pump